MDYVEKIIKKIPDNWKEIRKEDYPFFGVYTNSAFETHKAYLTKESNVITINSYDEDDMIEQYDNQMQEIASVLQNKKWKEISNINPLKHEMVKYEDVDLYYSCYEVNSSEEFVALQFYVKKDKTIGFLTAIKKPENLSFEYLLDKNELVKQIMHCIK